MHNVKLALSLLQLKVDHLYLFLLLANLLLAILKNIFLNVRFFVQNAEFVITVNKLDTHVITGLASLFILVNQVVHLLLQRVYDQVQLVGLVDLLADDRLLLTELVLLFVQLSAVGVTVVSRFLHVVLHFNQRAILFSRLDSQDLDFVLENLYSFFHLGKVLL